jgi:hypothetical protein
MSLDSTRRPEDLEPIEWVNEVTLIARGGHDIGLEQGDRFRIEDATGERIEVRVSKVADEKSVLQRVGSGFSHYGKRSVGELVRRV